MVGMTLKSNYYYYFILRYPGFVCFWSLSTSYRCSEVNMCGWHDIKLQLLLLLHTEVSRACLPLEFVCLILIEVSRFFCLWNLSASY